MPAGRASPRACGGGPRRRRRALSPTSRNGSTAFSRPIPSPGCGRNGWAPARSTSRPKAYPVWTESRRRDPRRRRGPPGSHGTVRPPHPDPLPAGEREARPPRAPCRPPSRLREGPGEGGLTYRGVGVLRTAPFVVMPGLVPGIHVPPPLGPRPARTAMPQDVDTRNKSGHDVWGKPVRHRGAHLAVLTV